MTPGALAGTTLQIPRRSQSCTVKRSLSQASSQAARMHPCRGVAPGSWWTVQVAPGQAAGAVAGGDGSAIPFQREHFGGHCFLMADARLERLMLASSVGLGGDHGHVLWALGMCWWLSQACHLLCMPQLWAPALAAWCSRSRPSKTENRLWWCPVLVLCESWNHRNILGRRDL